MFDTGSWVHYEREAFSSVKFGEKKTKFQRRERSPGKLDSSMMSMASYANKTDQNETLKNSGNHDDLGFI